MNVSSNRQGWKVNEKRQTERARAKVVRERERETELEPCLESRSKTALGIDRFRSTVSSERTFSLLPRKALHP